MAKPKIYLMYDNAEFYRTTLEYNLDVDIVIGTLDDADQLLNGGHKDYALMFFDRSYGNSLEIANKVVNVAGKAKCVVVVDEITRKRLGELSAYGTPAEQAQARRETTFLKPLTELDVGDGEIYVETMANHITKQTGAVRLMNFYVSPREIIEEVVFNTQMLVINAYRNLKDFDKELLTLIGSNFRRLYGESTQQSLSELSISNNQIPRYARKFNEDFQKYGSSAIEAVAEILQESYDALINLSKGIRTFGRLLEKRGAITEQI